MHIFPNMLHTICMLFLITLRKYISPPIKTPL